ncbi:hypothetical protein [Lentzea flaviverrucosa]|uniref:Anti-anti-sigma factor n=1 Tax=Lentzea flaviverrucosa TaxID=200379 RepID=A0A1H9XSG8_9PSEU|nr:hypothetical protein [Lentzea flaviverrucosa]RDI19305.1 hypothetical protein DFR72_117147 [Lentzea flaviverrucosa]SES49102.1 hypothetical protein SAMN05216195_11771 [Lentzea flaviverrucosa]
MPDLDDPAKSASANAVEVTGPDAEGSVTVRARGVVDAAAFAAALARTGDPETSTVVVDLLEVDSFSMEAASALLSHQRAVSRAMTPNRRLLLRPSPAVIRKLDLLGLTAVLLGNSESAK